MIQSEKAIIRAARKWWESHRGQGYSLEDHLANPHMNLSGTSEYELASAVAQDVRTKAEMLTKAADLKARTNATRRSVGLAPLHPKLSRAARSASVKAKKVEKRAARALIRLEVFKRSEVDGVPRCEGPLFFNRADPDRCGNIPTQFAHAFGRGKGRRPESVENCMALCGTCAYQETNNIPDAGFWWNFRAEFFERNGYTAEAKAARDRLAFVEARSTLGAGLKERHRAQAEAKIQELESKVHKAVFTGESER